MWNVGGFGIGEEINDSDETAQLNRIRHQNQVFLLRFQEDARAFRLIIRDLRSHLVSLF
jgi:hypothetical protein